MTGDRNDLAAELALGVLTGDELRAALELERSDAEFRSQVARWSGRLAPFLDSVEPATPPSSVWVRIDREIDGSPGAGNVVQLRRRVSRWQTVSGLMTAVAASLALFILFRPTPAPVIVQRPVATPLVAALGNPKSGTKMVVSWNAAAQQLVLVVAGDMPSDPRHSHELWVIPHGGKPRSLGTMAATKQAHMQLAATLAELLQQGATIAISVEPRGGSPTGAPTGPVVASGALTRA